MPVLSEKDWDFWRENGYVVVHNAVPQENLDAMVDTIWTFLDMDRDNPEDWYKYKPYTRGESVFDDCGVGDGGDLSASGTVG